MNWVIFSKQAEGKKARNLYTSR